MDREDCEPLVEILQVLKAYARDSSGPSAACASTDTRLGKKRDRISKAIKSCEALIRKASGNVK